MAKINKQDEIKFLESDLEAVRKLPDVYIGALGNSGYVNMCREIIQNSLDEIIKGNTLDKNIIISFDARTHMLIVEDRGQGIPTDILAKVFLVLHSSSNYDKKAGSGKYSSGKNGMGATITNFLSKLFIVESYRMDGTASRVEFNEGELVSQTDIPCPKGKHGLMTTFVPSDMMGAITISPVDLYNLIWSIAHLCKIGTRITYNSIDIDGRKNTTIIENTDGIFELLNNAVDESVINPIYLCKDNGTMKIEALFTYDLSSMMVTEPKILGFANMCPTDGGTHIDGFLDGVVKYFRNYMNKIYLANNKKLSVNAQDIRTSLCAVISAFHIEPMFTGQSKEKFSKEEMRPYAAQVTEQALKEWEQSNPKELQKLAKYLKEICTARLKQDKEKVKIANTYKKSVFGDLPSNYKKPNGKKHIEVFIFEGKSASPENARDKECQGFIGVRGKMPNAFIKSKQDYFNNEEVAGLFKIFGYEDYNFDPDKFIPEKVIIMTDADADGAHIRCLLFSMFLRYLPFVIEQGKLYAGNPPLYSIEVGKKKIYFNDNKDYINYVLNLLWSDYEICDINGNKYDLNQVTSIIHSNMYYVEEVNKIAGTYSIDPGLLEFVLYNKDLQFDKFSEVIKQKYRFIKTTNNNGTIIIDGLVNSKVQTLFLNDRLISDCSYITDMIRSSDNFFLINGELSTIYDLMSIFKRLEPKNMTRYKGLGEMEPDDLAQSTILPNSGRTLRQYTINDCKAELAYLMQAQSDKSVFIKGLNIKKEDII